MNNTSLACITATAGTCVCQDTWIENCHYHYSIQNFNPWPFGRGLDPCAHIFIHTNTIPPHLRPFLQIAGSAFRLLTNIPHCCTIMHWILFISNVVDRPFRLDYGILS
uniref:Uncharacterized protein n=1 Tax=Orbilia brochopaga TaxID=3140254 RepID=A0A481ZML1_9PEZI|nr:hypothetical protein [Drechslerella brochopaga]QBL02542.1 hypothetical protein [Drechslerella brochopaga]